MSSDKFEVYDITNKGLVFEDFEQLGTKAKHWVIDSENEKFLFKEGRPNTGENWAEVLACHIADAIDLPHAGYHLATEAGKAGVLSNTFVPDGGRLIHGNELLLKISSSHGSLNRRSIAKQHTISRVKAVTKRLPNKPRRWDSIFGVKTAEEVFTGYLLLDTLIANQDRHMENWGYILTSDGTVHLAPSFDHASSLGRNETDENMKDRLSTSDRGRSIDAYILRAKSSLYLRQDDTKPLSTIDAFKTWASSTPIAAKSWIDQLAKLSDENIRSLVEKIPDELISSVAVEFTTKMLILNKERLIKLKCEL